MNYSEYKEKAFKTLSDKGDQFLNMAHMFNGLDSEVGEIKGALKKAIFYKQDIEGFDLTHLDKTNVIEELGDCCWFIAVADVVSEIGLEWDDDLDVKSPTSDLDFYHGVVMLSCLTSDLDYQLMRYSNADISKLKMTVALITSLATHLDCKPSDLFKSNIRKLEKRYGDGYFDSVATEESNRDRDGERDAIIH